MESLTQIIKAIDNSNEDALDKLIGVAYDRLHASAKIALGQTGHASTLQATELVNELYIFFKQRENFEYNNSAHFFATAALKLRQILLDRYRKNAAKKRDFGERVDTEQMDSLSVEPPLIETLIVNGYIDQIQKIDPDAARVVDLLIFWEFSFAEVAEILSLSERTVYRKWKWATTWLSTRTAK